VTVSVTAEILAYIVLCEGRDPFSSACYSIILGGSLKDKDDVCFIRRCPNGVNRNSYPTESCNTPVDSKTVSINTKCELMCGTVTVSAPGGYKQKSCSVCNSHVNSNGLISNRQICILEIGSFHHILDTIIKYVAFGL
jgi:hypothetical protein